MCIREEVQKADKHPDQYNKVEAKRHDGDRQMQNTELWGDIQKQGRPRDGETRTADDSLRPGQNPEGGREVRGNKEKTVQCESDEEPSGEGAGLGSGEGSDRDGETSKKRNLQAQAKRRKLNPTGQSPTKITEKEN